MNNRKTIIQLGWFTLVGFPLISLTIVNYVSGNWQHIFKGAWPLYYQLPLGIAIGLISGFGLRAFLQLPFLRDTNNQYSRLIEQFELNRQEFVFLSVCAGVGEEILFRGCVQEYAGVMATSVIFVALHGYLNPMNYRISSYGLVLTGLFAGVGCLMTATGIYTCIVIHIIIDIILFDHLLSSGKNKN